jgi:hypothetical protein
MRVIVPLASVALILLVLMDAFETMILPRRVRRQFRFARLFYVYSWKPWGALARMIRSEKRRNTFLSLFGPLSIIILLVLWAAGLIVGFALLHWGLATPLGTRGSVGLQVYSYFSGVTFFTLGYGDITPSDPLGRFLAVVETGVGFGFLAVIISYLPVLYQAFSRREVSISLLDARAGSPPTAGTLLGRLARLGDLRRLDIFLREWEYWAAEVLESHLSFPVLTYYRSQHDNQSWLSALTAILDTSALVVASIPEPDTSQALMTFAMGRHAVVDLAQSFHVPPVDPPADRLPPAQWRAFRETMKRAGLDLNESEEALQRLAELRGMYEPFVTALSIRFLMPLPPVFTEGEPVDNWQTSAWMRRARGFRQLTARDRADDHED